MSGQTRFTEKFQHVDPRFRTPRVDPDLIERGVSKYDASRLGQAAAAVARRAGQDACPVATAAGFPPRTATTAAILFAGAAAGGAIRPFVDVIAVAVAVPGLLLSGSAAGGADLVAITATPGASRLAVAVASGAGMVSCAAAVVAKVVIHNAGQTSGITVGSR